MLNQSSARKITGRGGGKMTKREKLITGIGLCLFIPAVIVVPVLLSRLWCKNEDFFFEIIKIASYFSWSHMLEWIGGVSIIFAAFLLFCLLYCFFANINDMFNDD